MKNANAVPDFAKYSYRGSVKRDKLHADQAQVTIAPNKEYALRSLRLGAVDFGAQVSRAARDKAMKREIIDKDAASPDIYTHHDNAVARMHDIKQTS